MPILGRIADAMGVIWIDNTTAEGCDEAKLIITEKIKNKNIPPILIFPQGTTSNFKSLTAFKTGAFMTGDAVLPVALHFEGNKWCDMSYFGDRLFYDIFQPWSQFINFVKIDVLPIYYPNKKEKEYSQEYGQNVRKIIGKRLNATITSHSFADFVFDNLAKAYGFRTELK